MKTLIRNIGKLVGIVPEGTFRKEGEEMGKVGYLDNAWLLIDGEKIDSFGQEGDNRCGTAQEAARIIDAAGGYVMPSFCDSHSHIVYAGSRYGEFRDKIDGLTYEQIAARGGGILNSADLLHETSEEELFRQSLERAVEVMNMGTGALEIKSGNNPRGTMQSLLQSAGLSENDTELLPTGTLRQIINAVAWIPLGVAALLFLHQLWRLAPLGKMGRQVTGFALLLMAAMVLPKLLIALPRWLIPSRWSDMNFWMDLGNLVQQSLVAFVSLTNSIRDHLIGTQILAFGGCLLGLLAGALLLVSKELIGHKMEPCENTFHV